MKKKKGTSQFCKTSKIQITVAIEHSIFLFPSQQRPYNHMSSSYLQRPNNVAAAKDVSPFGRKNHHSTSYTGLRKMRKKRALSYRLTIILIIHQGPPAQLQGLETLQLQQNLVALLHQNPGKGAPLVLGRGRHRSRR